MEQIHSFTNFIKGDQRALFSLGGYFCRRSEFIWIPGVNSLDSEGRPDFKLPTVIVFILPGFTFELVPSAKNKKRLKNYLGICFRSNTFHTEVR